MINDNLDVLTWLANKSGIGFDNVLIGNSKDNTYVLNGAKITHEELMTMLYERFPG